MGFLDSRRRRGGLERWPGRCYTMAVSRLESQPRFPQVVMTTYILGDPVLGASIPMSHLVGALDKVLSPTQQA